MFASEVLFATFPPICIFFHTHRPVPGVRVGADLHLLFAGPGVLLPPGDRAGRLRGLLLRLRRRLRLVEHRPSARHGE